MKDIYRTGVYEIRNQINNKLYIGSTGQTHKQKSMRGFYRRFEHHKQAVRKGKHSNRYLQNAWNKYGEKNFSFKILALCPPEYCIKLEQWFLDNLKPVYNIRKIADSNLGIKQSISHIEKRSHSMTEGYYNNPDRRAAHYHRKLDEEQVKDIKFMLSKGYTLRKCGNKHGVYSSTIQNIKTGRTWKDIKI